MRFSDGDGMKSIDYRGGIHFIVRGAAGTPAATLPEAWKDGPVYKVLTKYSETVAEFAAVHDFPFSERAAGLLAGDEVAPEIKPFVAVSAPETRRVTLSDNRFLISFAFAPEVVAEVNRIKGVVFDRDARVWMVAAGLESAAAILALKDIGFALSPEVQSYSPEVSKRASTQLGRLSSQIQSDYVQPKSLQFPLHNFQGVAVEYGSESRRFFNGDTMGLGKTIESIALLEELEAKGVRAYPAVIVVPAVAKYTWGIEIAKWIPSRTVQVLEGKQQSVRYDSDIVILNYDILGAKKVRKGSRIKFVPRPGGHLERLLALPSGIGSVICDESHYLKTAGTLRTEAVRLLVSGVGTRMFLSGTMVENRPSELIEQLRLLGRLDDFGGWKNFATRYCRAHRDRFGWNLSGSANEVELHEKLRATCMVRRLTEDVQSQLPALQRSIVPVDITNRKRYKSAVADLKLFLREAAREAGDKIDSVELSRQLSAVQRAEHLVKIAALRHIVAEGKLEAARLWIGDFLTNTNEKLIVFGWHKDIVGVLSDEFCRGRKITGEVSAKKRVDIVAEFQNDPEQRVLALNLLAGGVNLTLTKATKVLFVELGWNFAQHEQAEARTHGRQDEIALARSALGEHVTAYYLLGNDTFDGDMFDIIRRKKKLQNAILDGTNNAPSEEDAASVVKALFS